MAMTRRGLQLPMETTTVTMVVVMDTVMMLVVVATKEDVVPLLLVVQVLEPVVVALVAVVEKGHTKGPLCVAQQLIPHMGSVSLSTVSTYNVAHLPQITTTNNKLNYDTPSNLKLLEMIALSASLINS
jgi:hypothetical protein